MAQTPTVADQNIDSVLQEKRVFPPPPEFSAQAHIKSLEEYERSPFLIAPLRKYDLAYLFDGGAAVVVARLPWARDHTACPVSILGPALLR